MAYEEVGLRLRTDGVPEAGNGVDLLAQALGKLAGQAGVAAGPLQEASTAATALGAGVNLSTVAVLGATAGIIAAAVAYRQISREQQEFHRAIILTGNAAGVTAGMLQDMAAQASAAVGTQAKASEIIAQLTSTAQVSRAQLAKSTEAAIALERTFGIEVSETVKIFASLGGDPVRAVAKLNQTTNFLTLEVWAQIRALQERGRTEEAAALAQDTYAKAAIERAQEMERHLGTLQKAWRWVGETAKEAWDRMLNIGRRETVDAQLAGIQDNIKYLEKLQARPGNVPAQNAQYQAEIDFLRQQQAELQELDRVQRRVADSQAQRAAAVRAQVSADTGRKPAAPREVDPARGINEEITRRLVLVSAELEAGRELNKVEREHVELMQRIAELEQKGLNPAAADQLRQRAEALRILADDARVREAAAKREVEMQKELEKIRERELKQEQQRAETFEKYLDEARKREADDARRRQEVIEESLYNGIANGFKRGENPAQLFLRMLKNEFARNILRVPVQFVAAAQRSAIDSIIGSIGSWLGLGGNGSAGSQAAADEVYQGAGGFASPASAGAGALSLVAPSISKSRAAAPVVTYAPVINIDSRTDRAEVVELVEKRVRAGNAELLDQLDRRQA